jgi:hypothetical protein
MAECDRVVLSGEFADQRLRLSRIARRHDQGEPMGRESVSDRARRPSCSEDARHPEQVRLHQQRSQRFQEPFRITVVAERSVFALRERTTMLAAPIVAAAPSSRSTSRAAACLCGMVTFAPIQSDPHGDRRNRRAILLERP